VTRKTCVCRCVRANDAQLSPRAFLWDAALLRKPCDAAPPAVQELSDVGHLHDGCSNERLATAGSARVARALAAYVILSSAYVIGYPELH